MLYLNSKLSELLPAIAPFIRICPLKELFRPF